MKTPHTIFWKDGVMKAFEMPQEISLVGYSKGLASKMLGEYKGLVEAARLSALPVANHSIEKINEILKEIDEDPRFEHPLNWIPDQTKSYQIEAEFREENAVCKSASGSVYKIDKKVLVLSSNQ